MKKKGLILSTTLALSLSFSAVSADTIATNETGSNLSTKIQSSQGSAFDPGIANDEKLIKMLKENGTIAKDASAAEAQKALQKYLKTKADSAKKTKDNLSNSLDAKMKDSENKNNNPLTNGKGNKLGHAKKNKVDSVEGESYNGEVRKDNVLVLAIDFPDYEKSSITPEETDMWYENYPIQHFQDMIFGEDG